MTVARLQPYAVTIFAEMSALAARVGAVNLGQGFPDEDGPAAMLKTAENAIADGVNQYPPGLGIAPLREAIAAQRSGTTASTTTPTPRCSSPSAPPRPSPPPSSVWSSPAPRCC